jgi:hypothetical protein
VAKSAVKKVRFDPGEITEKSEAEKKLDRNEELSGKEDIKDALLEIFDEIKKGFEQQSDRSDSNMDYWDCYNCVLGNQQFYNGNSKIFVPIVYNAVNARKTRFVNQLFPVNGRYVEVTTEDGTLPQTEMALLEHYVRQCKLRTRVAPAIMKNADIEGHVTVQVTWEEKRRHVVYKVQKPPQLEEAVPDTEDVEDIEEEEIVNGGPDVRVIADSDLLVLPFTADSLEQALADGGSVTTLCRWSRAKLKKKIKEGEIDTEAGNAMLEEMKKESSPETRTDKAKEMIDAAGIKGDGRGKFALIYRTWTMLTIDGERRICLAYYGGKDRLLSCKRNPYWSDRIDIISAPADKVDGSFKGVSRLKAVADLQYQANDACNEGMDSAAYALMPIVFTDPEKNPEYGSMILSLAAVWKTSPADTQFAKFPALWKDALEIIAACETKIFQSLSVNPAQITQANNPKGKKPNQAEIANEQQIDLLTTADAVTIIEDEILTPILLFMLELDHQYRDKELTVREYGGTGMKANMMQIPTVSMGHLYQFRWFGVESARNAQQMQQQIGALNVIMRIPPQSYPGYMLNLGPVLAQMIENLFGPRLAPLTFVDTRNNPQLQQAEAMQVTQPFAQPPPGQQGGNGAGPRAGAMPAQQRPAQQPAGAIHADQMKDPMVAPRM